MTKEPGTNPRDVKLSIKKIIMGQLHKYPAGCNIDMLRAQIELDTGFGRNTIDRIMMNLEIVGMVSLLNGKIRLIQK